MSEPISEEQRLVLVDAQRRRRTQETFRKDLQALINHHSLENGSNTPDRLLADYLADCLSSFDRAVSAREAWYGRGPRPIAQPANAQGRDEP